MTAHLTVHVLDESQFPELERAPGVYGIEPALLQPGSDPRVPAPKGSLAVLRVSYTLLAADVPWGSRWQLEAVGLSPDGKERRVVWQLLPPPPKRDNRRPIRPDTDPTPTPGALDRGIFWVDLDQPLRQQQLRPGDQLVLRLAQAQAVIRLPAAPGR